MDFLKKAEELTNAAKQLAEQGAGHLSDSINKAQSAATEIATTGLATVEHLSAQSLQIAQQTSEAVQQTLENTSQQVQDIAASGITKAQELKENTAAIAEHGITALQQTAQNITATTAGIGLAGLEVANALKDLPKTVEQLAQEMPKIAQRMKTAGLRVGDAPRSDADVLKLFEKIPGTSKLEANERNIRVFLSDKHGSHIISRKDGGSNGANNIVWEVGQANLQRGARAMTSGEQVYIRFHNAVDSILKNSATIGKLGVTATGTAIITQAVITAASYALDLYRGDITVEEFKDKVKEAAIAAGIATPIFFLLLIATLALFPEFVIVLSAPAVVAGFNVLLGISVATPIIQSIMRHLDRGGFGQEAAEQYQNFVNETQQFLEASTNQVVNFGEACTTQLKGLLPAAEEVPQQP